MNFAMNADATPNYRGARKLAGKLVEDYTAPSIPAVEVAEQNGVNVIFADMGKFKDEVAGFCDFKSKRNLCEQGKPPQQANVYRCTRTGALDAAPGCI